jgi:hypothetical protein
MQGVDLSIIQITAMLCEKVTRSFFFDANDAHDWMLRGQ